MKKLTAILTACILTTTAAVFAADPHGAAAPSVTPEHAMAILFAGNGRYIAGEPQAPRRDNMRRDETNARGQHPIAAVLACADSRVPVEVLFDQGIGDIFTVRVAGNVAGEDEIGSLEYAIEHLHVPLVIVLGHSKCGAVGAAIAGGELPKHIAKLVDQITPATDEVKKKDPSLTGDPLSDACIRANAFKNVRTLLSESEITREAVQTMRLKVVAGVYDISTGQVRILGEHPQQKELVPPLIKPAEKTTPAAEKKEASHVSTEAKPAEAKHEDAKPAAEHGHGGH